MFGQRPKLGAELAPEEPLLLEPEMPEAAEAVAKPHLVGQARVFRPPPSAVEKDLFRVRLAPTSCASDSPA